MHHALLLLAGEVSVINTATACGWVNPSAFIDAFTTLVGQTPGQYQRSLRQGA
ncbi:helix-turn-helix domain-containing protein [Streptomyces sp. NPDC056486]|uniref:helix-turn-helix domain-containing protein n=1 Tax=Streptomyces sp. NPDC056486 TaxID=3345835 RepID=UPI0036D0097C